MAPTAAYAAPTLRFRMGKFRRSTSPASITFIIPPTLNSTSPTKSIRATSDYIHALGLKFGVYSAASQRTCGNFSASMFLEQLDADTFANDWMVDCESARSPFTIAPARKRARLAATCTHGGLHILFAQCSNPSTPFTPPPFTPATAPSPTPNLEGLKYDSYVLTRITRTATPPEKPPPPPLNHPFTVGATTTTAWPAARAT